MKKLFNVMAVAIALGVVGHATAASNVDLSVKGSITPSACMPVIGNGGVVEHGKISFQDLQPNGETVLPSVIMPLTINCAASTLFAINSTDNRNGSSSEWTGGSSGFGLGFVNGDLKVGFYLLKMNNSKADGVPQAVIESADGKTWFDAQDDNQMWQPKWMRAFKDATAGAISPMPVQVMTTDIVVSTTITSKVQLPATQEIPIDGSATLDIVYL
ncbi:DUF1120 domain-containing protein [Pseudomonas sp. Marseille-Q1929]|uniref:DUF1120 domain-containing protein n=1 Tax=Pseudomonas sp. Marseille-Q1929 TaxID=2730402 RepID=UPI001A8ED593|nr:DUF1120 domain-containing protein [Pseudomonas sp. Marseille-Q1929]MBO0491808.1 DUF1120 domain-containing protein [Pseudomonas sp. Marseille-Q1929]